LLPFTDMSQWGILEETNRYWSHASLPYVMNIEWYDKYDV
jgi:hypothetical protein